MTAPLDIGLEHTDSALHTGQDDDMFDLGDTTKALARRGGISRLLDADDDDSSDEEGAEEEDEHEEALDSEEEREKKVAELEDELDGLYDAYQERMKERDAKYKAKEARKGKEAENWHGLRKGDDSDDDDSGDEEGGWDTIQKAKARAGEDSSDDESDIDDEEDVSAGIPKKRRRVTFDEDQAKSMKKARLQNGASSSTGPTPVLSRTAQNWFSQFDEDINAEDLEDSEDGSDVEEEEEEEDETDSASDEPEDSSNVGALCLPY